MDLTGFVLNTKSSIHHACFLFFYEPSPIDFSKIIGYMAATAQVAYGEKMRQPFTKWTFITLYVFKS